MGAVMKTPAMAASMLLEHVVYYALRDRIGEEKADDFIHELTLIADGKVLHGFAHPNPPVPA